MELIFLRKSLNRLSKNCSVSWIVTSIQFPLYLRKLNYSINVNQWKQIKTIDLISPWGWNNQYCKYLILCPNHFLGNILNISQKDVHGICAMKTGRFRDRKIVLIWIFLHEKMLFIYSKMIYNKNQKSCQNLYHTKNNHRPITALWAGLRWPGVLILEYRFDMRCDTDVAMFILLFSIYLHRLNTLLDLNKWTLLLSWHVRK